MFRQADDRWKNTHLGQSNFTMASAGCVTTCIAEALRLAGYDLTPGQVVDAFNNHAVYTDSHYLETAPGRGDGQPGLVIWDAIVRAFPQVHFESDNSGALILHQGIWRPSRSEHWILEYQGKFYNSIDDSEGTVTPVGFQPGIKVRTLAIDPFVAPTPAPAPETQPEVVPEAPTPPAPATNEVAVHTVAKGDTLSEIVAEHYGLSHWADIKAKFMEVAAHNGIKNPNLIKVDQKIELP